MEDDSFKPEHWNRGVVFGFGLTIMTSCLSGLIPGLPSFFWDAGVLFGFILMIASAKPLYSVLRAKCPRTPRKEMVALGIGIIVLMAVACVCFWPHSHEMAQTHAIESKLVKSEDLRLHDLFVSDLAGHSFNVKEQYSVFLYPTPNEKRNVDFELGLYGDFTAGSEFMSVFLPATDYFSDFLIWFSANYTNYLYDFNKTLHIFTPPKFGESPILSDDLLFTKQVYIYTENILSNEQKFKIEAAFRSAGLKPTFRGFAYLSERRSAGVTIAVPQTITPPGPNAGLLPQLVFDPNKETQPSLLTLFMTDFKGDGKGWKLTAGKGVTVSFSGPNTAYTCTMFFSVNYDKTNKVRRVALYVPPFQFPEKAIEYAAGKMSDWMPEADAFAASKNVDWIKSALFDNRVYLYTENLPDIDIDNVEKKFLHYGTKVELRGTGLPS